MRHPLGRLGRPRPRRLLALLTTAGLALAGAVALPGTAQAANVLSNPGFETGSLSPWSCSGNLGSVVSSPVRSGSRALAGAVSASDIAKCVQTVAVRPNTTYTLSGWVRGSYVYLGVEGGPSTWTTSPSAYRQLSVTFTTGPSQTSAQVYTHGWYAQGTYYADDLNLDGPGGSSDTQAPTAPSNLRSTGRTSSSVSLAWNGSTDNVGVVAYDLFAGSQQVLSVSGTSATVSGLSPSTAYTFTVRARDAAGNSSAASNSVTVTTDAGSGGGGDGGAFKQAAPYLYLGWGDPPSATTVMSQTGVKWYTLAFILSSGGCTPAWDGNRPLTGGNDQSVINAIRSAGGDIVPSIGGWSGNKLGPDCSTPEALAGAYQRVIDAYRLKAIDVDIENTDEFENAAVQDRILTALRIVKRNNPGLKTIITFGTTTTGPNYWGNRLIEQAKALNADIDVFTIMPFDFGGSDMYADTVRAADGLRNKLKSTFGWNDATAYAHIGISGMNGLSDQQEVTTPATWRSIRDWANSQHIARLAYWSVNRDRPCPGGGVVANCSGISQGTWEFTSITAGFTG